MVLYSATTIWKETGYGRSGEIDSAKWNGVDVALTPKIGANVRQQLEGDLKDEEDAVTAFWPTLPPPPAHHRLLRALVPAEPKISEHILYPLSHISLNLHVRRLRISEPHFALPRQQLIPISS